MSDKRPLETSPRGVAKWITINTPDTTYKPEGEYKVTLLLQGQEAANLQKKIDDAIAVGVAMAKSDKDNAKHLKNIKASDDKPYRTEVDKEGNATGFTQFRFKAKASGTRKDKTTWTFKPRVFDNMGQPIDLTKTPVWGGSEVRVAYEIGLYGEKAPFNSKMGVGVTLKISAVQILKLVTGKGKEASDFGFGVEEGEMPGVGGAQGGTVDGADY
ncbi:MAG: hypothetical protein ACRCZI_05445 [Cetobacterium sp.]